MDIKTFSGGAGADVEFEKGGTPKGSVENLKTDGIYDVLINIHSNKFI